LLCAQVGSRYGGGRLRGRRGGGGGSILTLAPLVPNAMFGATLSLGLAALASGMLASDALGVGGGTSLARGLKNSSE
jgi:hypothetical protein